MPLDAPMMTAVLRSAGGVITVFLLLRFCGRTASYRRRRPASCLGPRYLPIVSHADFFSAWRSSSTLLPGNTDKELEFPTRAGKWAFDAEARAQLIRSLFGIGDDPEIDFGPIRTYGLLRLPPRHVMIIARSEEHTSELQSLMRNSYAVFCLTKQK